MYLAMYDETRMILIGIIILVYLCFRVFGVIVSAGILLMEHFHDDNLLYKKFSIKRRLVLSKLYKDCDYFRDIPNQGKLCVSYALLKDFGVGRIPDKNVINAMILQMVIDKNIVIIDKPNGKYDILLDSKPKDKSFNNLYDILKYAAKDKILELDELKKYVFRHYEIYDDYIYSFIKDGRKCLNNKGAYKKLSGVTFDDLTDLGIKELGEIYGLKKFLEDFTLIEIRGTREVVIWEYLLVYASLFDLAEKFYKENKDLVPINIDVINTIGRSIGAMHIYDPPKFSYDPVELIVSLLKDRN